MFFFFFFNDTATTEIYTLSLHDALPICCDLLPRDLLAVGAPRFVDEEEAPRRDVRARQEDRADRKSTRLNSSHSQISYAVFCLKKKNTHCSISTRLLRDLVAYTTVQPHH